GSVPIGGKSAEIVAIPFSGSAGGAATVSTGGSASVSGAVVIGRSGAGVGAATTGAAACTLVCEPPAAANDTPTASSAATIRASFEKLSISVFLARTAGKNREL